MAQQPPRMMATFKNEEERQIADVTLNSYNLSFSQDAVTHCAIAHSTGFSIHHVAIQFL